ncbi:MAG: hypothetical protein A2057_04790 [Ignavibacteria bacterium GWA2_35_9]|nr:MAG: hypothetical protein A2057_04790 [Ignavibacteria bacterium GWA2_35_9]OGU47916.1 MAG: hypothetical protein A2000_14655 [Ignavibacteria bacterium GWB2_36_8]OGU48749.1 MAG: hypothetical protein A2080_05905 [Ignavibacteria bacterium GWC2_36_12]
MRWSNLFIEIIFLLRKKIMAKIEKFYGMDFFTVIEPGKFGYSSEVHTSSIKRILPKYLKN